MKPIEHQQSLYQIGPAQQNQPLQGDLECPAAIMMKHVVPALEQLLHEKRICIDDANNIILSRMVPVELAQSIGLVAAPPYSTTHSGLNLTTSGSAAGSQNIPTSTSGTASPCNFYGAATSPMHQITKGISGLTTGGGSITRGTSIASDMSSEPLDLSMDVSGGLAASDQTSPTITTSWQMPSMFYDLNQMSLSPVQQLRVVPTPPASPNLCIIQEEMLNTGVSCSQAPGTMQQHLHLQQQLPSCSGVSLHLTCVPGLILTSI